MLTATGSAVPKVWEVGVLGTQYHFRPCETDLDVFIMCFRKHVRVFNHFRTITTLDEPKLKKKKSREFKEKQ